jgi:hypothetical protein
MTSPEHEPLLQTLSHAVPESELEQRRSSAAAAELEDDPDNPLNWRPLLKWTIVSLTALMGFTM